MKPLEPSPVSARVGDAAVLALLQSAKRDSSIPDVSRLATFSAPLTRLKRKLRDTNYSIEVGTNQSRVNALKEQSPSECGDLSPLLTRKKSCERIASTPNILIHTPSPSISSRACSAICLKGSTSAAIFSLASSPASNAWSAAMKFATSAPPCFRIASSICES